MANGSRAGNRKSITGVDISPDERVALYAQGRYLPGDVAAGGIGTAAGSANGLIGPFVPPIIAEDDGGVVRLRLSPHLHLSEEKDLERTGARQWQISC